MSSLVCSMGQYPSSLFAYLLVLLQSGHATFISCVKAVLFFLLAGGSAAGGLWSSVRHTVTGGSAWGPVLGLGIMRYGVMRHRAAAEHSCFCDWEVGGDYFLLTHVCGWVDLCKCAAA